MSIEKSDDRELANDKHISLRNHPSDHPIRVGQNVVSRRRLARLVGCTPSHIGLIWSGQRNPSIELINKIALVFDVTMDEIWEVIQANANQGGQVDAE